MARTRAVPARLTALLKALLLLLPHHGILSSAQEAPTLNSIPSFSYDHGEGYRTNVCDRQRLVADGDVSLRNALQGLNLTVAMTNYAGVPNENRFFALTDEGAIRETDPGLFVVIMDEIARRAGFEWRHSFHAVTPPGPGKSWTDLLVWETTHFDIAADYWARSVERMSKGVAFPHGWYDGSIVMASRAKVENEPFDPKSFLVPFEYSVWFAILGAIVATGIAYFFLERLNNDADDRSLENKPFMTVFIAALTFTGHFEFQPNSISSRLLSISWGFWAVIVTSAYTANLASFLVSQGKTVVRISTLEEALLTSTPLCVQRGAVVDNILTEKHPELKLVRKSTEEDMFLGLSLDWYGGGGGCGALLTNLGTYDIYASQLSTNSDCSLGSDKRVLLNLPAGYATAVDTAIKCSSLVNYVMDLHLQEMRAEKFIQTAWDNHVAKGSTMQCNDPNAGTSASNGAPKKDKNSSGSNSLSMKEMGGIFLAHFGLCLVAFMFALYQYYHAKQFEPEKKLRPINLDVTEAVEESVRQVNESMRLMGESVSNLGGSVSNLNVGGGPDGRMGSSFRWTSSRGGMSMNASGTLDNSSSGTTRRRDLQQPASFWSSNRNMGSG